MTANGPYTQSMDYKFTQNIRPAGKPVYIPDNSIMGFLENNNGFSLFRDILYKSGYAYQYREKVSVYTLFVASDKAFLNTFPDMESAREYVDNMNVLNARKIIQYCTLNRKICSELLTASPHKYFISKLPAENIEITNLNCKSLITIPSGREGTQLYLQVKPTYAEIIEFNICVDNGVIHLTDRLIVPKYMSTASYFSQTY